MQNLICRLLVRMSVTSFEQQKRLEEGILR